MKPAAHVLNLLAEVLDYPRADLRTKAAALAEALQDRDAAGAGALGRFERYVAARSHAEMEELYTRSFDMNVGNPLYVGYHLYGDTYKRGEMMSALQGAYARHALEDSELPDHLCRILRWLACRPDAAECGPILNDYVLPAVRKVADSFGDEDNVYNMVIGAAARAVARSAVNGGTHR